jgi:hypothetical protein
MNPPNNDIIKFSTLYNKSVKQSDKFYLKNKFM